MSLLRLLTAGKSLVGIKSSEPRYRLSHPLGLPKFGAKRNPFRATTLPEGTQSAPSVPQPEPIPEHADAPEPEPTPVAVPQPTASENTVKLVIPKPSPCPTGSAPPSLSSWFERRTKTLKSLLGRRRGGKASNSVRRSAKPMVQAELSLEKVRVMRNDLSDSDLEVVAAKPAGPPVSAPLARTVTKTGERSWTRMTGRFFGVGKT